MSRSTLQIHLREVSFQYDSAANAIFNRVTTQFEPGFTGVVGANGAGKSTLLQLISGDLKPDSGQIEGTSDLIHCPQRTDDPPRRFAELLEDDDGATYALRARLGVEYDFLERWHHLSHGERKRAQIATALWQAPDALTIDEPTNHIDSAARELLLESLRQFRGVGIIVSHDRALLDELCSHTLWLDGPEPVLYAGGYSKAKQQREQDQLSLQHERDSLRRSQKKLDQEVVKRREKAARSHKDRSKSGLAIKDHDARYKKNLARNSGKDGQAGRLLNQLGGRKDQLDQKLGKIEVNKQRSVGIWLEGSKARKQTLINVPEMELPMGNDRLLKTPPLVMQPTARIAVTGANGTGKSTLLAALQPEFNVPSEHLIFMPQEISAVDSRKLLADARSLGNDALGKLMTIVSALGSDPKRMLDSEQPSPGEIRKLLLAMGILREPWLIVMDEPTNHLDLPSIEALEQALAECPCALLLVSHDQDFLDSLATTEWHLSDSGNHSELQIQHKPSGVNEATLHL
jgi:ATPase subunit of ABC transporter with duplicated ATPase domains